MKQLLDSENIEEFFKYASDKNGVIWHCIKRRLNWPLEDDVVEFQWKRGCYAKAFYASGNSISISFTPNNYCAMTLDVLRDGKEESIAITEDEWRVWLFNTKEASNEDGFIYQNGLVTSIYPFSQRVAKNLLKMAIKDEHKWAIMEKIYDKMAEDREHFNDNWTLKCDTSVLAANIRYIAILLGLEINIENQLANLFINGAAKTGPKVNKPSRYTSRNLKGAYNTMLHGSDYKDKKEQRDKKKEEEKMNIKIKNEELKGDIYDFIDKKKCPEKREKLLAYLEDNGVFPYVKELLASQK